ncbi:hypothetical protein ACIQPT_32830 [Streptomyces sp. NPDC091289]|uniref:hypothetical protein n=1 Tax=Streptomyces sp. NPDC091289 TaxID=3365989 RepID=UPI0037F86ABD
MVHLDQALYFEDGDALLDPGASDAKPLGRFTPGWETAAGLGGVVLPGPFLWLLRPFPALAIGTMIAIMGVILVKAGTVLVTGRPGERGFADPMNLALGIATIGFTAVLLPAAHGSAAVTRGHARAGRRHGTGRASRPYRP